MSDANNDVEFSLTAMINKEKKKVLFAVADSHFTDILLSFLTLPLGRIVKVLEKHYGDEAPTIGSLSSLYHSLTNLDSAHFWTEGAKLTLLNPRSSFEAECEKLKLDITDSPPAEYFICNYCPPSHILFRSVSVYYDSAIICQKCFHMGTTSKKFVKEGSQRASCDGVFITRKASFIISDDLQILPNVTGLLGIISILGITDVDKAEQIKVSFGFNEIMNLLRASLTSQTPLSDLVLDKTRRMNSEKMSIHQIAEEKNPNLKKITLEVMIQKSTGKVLYAKAKEDFVEFLFSFFIIPLGGVEHLLGGKTCIKAINNLYRSTTDIIDEEYFKTPETKNRLIKPNLPHGCISKNQILPLSEEGLPAHYNDLLAFRSTKFPKGQGSFLEGPRNYLVTDDLTVTPFCIVSVLSSLKEMKIPISDVKELELQIGLKEGLSILKASLTSTSALTDALLTNHIPIKQPKQEI